MKFNPDIHHRHSIRLKNYDYSSNGLYFITICTQDRAMLYGEVVVGAGLVSARTELNEAGLVSARMALNEAGKMIECIYKETINSISNIISDIFIVMPNHVHCIIRVDRAETSPAPTTVGDFICAFKSKTTIEYINRVNMGEFSPFNKRVWQRNYYERIIRNEAEYQKIWQYIEENPARWQEDCYYG